MIHFLILLTLNTSQLVSHATDTILSQDSISATSTLLIPDRKELEHEAIGNSVPAPLLAAIVQEESSFDPWATRAEPKYYRNKKVRRAAARFVRRSRLGPNYFTELADRSRSYGLMQVMGETAREQGFDAPFLAELYVPANAIHHGAILLHKLLARYHGDTLAAISAYNSGSAVRSRKGLFANARYVYRVTVAWRAYAHIWKGGAR